MSPRRVSISFHPGDVFGKWTVIEYAAGSHAKVKCGCSCGTTQYVSGHSLTRKENQGCLKCKGGQKYVYPPLKDHPAYPRIIVKIHNIFRRCYNPASDHFEHYGGRGIGVYLPWHKDRAAMVKYITSLPGWDDPALQLDRENNDGDYAPGNLRFVSRSVNILNRRSKKEIAASRRHHVTTS